MLKFFAAYLASVEGENIGTWGLRMTFEAFESIN